jgi:hypothetical protein
MKTTLPNRCLALALVASAISLPAIAQSNRSRILSDSEMRARSENESRSYRDDDQHNRFPTPQQSASQARQAQITRDLQHLQSTSAVLQQSFAAHLKTRRISQDSPEAELGRGLADLVEDIKHLADDVLGSSSQQNKEINHIYRTFHMAEYSAENAQTLASQAGYSRSLREYFNDIDHHLAELGEIGLRNPRMQRVVEDEHHSYSRSEREYQVDLPQISQAPISSQGPGYQPGSEPRRQGTTIDLGDLLGRLFKGKSRQQ